MQIITLILSILAFLAGFSALILMIRERKRTRSGNKAFRKALVDYVDRKAIEITDGLAAGVRERNDIMNTKIEKALSIAKAANTRTEVIKKAVKENRDGIKQLNDSVKLLEDGCMPDFNEAMRAVNAVNEMNSGIANILGFDPMEALKKSKQEGE